MIKFKKTLFLLAFILLFCTNSLQAEEQSICGKAFTKCFVHQQTMWTSYPSGNIRALLFCSLGYAYCLVFLD